MTFLVCCEERAGGQNEDRLSQYAITANAEVRRKMMTKINEKHFFAIALISGVMPMSGARETPMKKPNPGIKKVSTKTEPR